MRGCDTPSNFIDILMHCRVTPNNYRYLTIDGICVIDKENYLCSYNVHTLWVVCRLMMHHNVHTLWVVCRLMMSTHTTSGKFFFMGWYLIGWVGSYEWELSVTYLYIIRTECYRFFIWMHWEFGIASLYIAFIKHLKLSSYMIG